MKITVFGCTGKTGREIVRQALERGYTVTAYARNPQKLEMTHLNANTAKAHGRPAAAVIIRQDTP